MTPRRKATVVVALGIAPLAMTGLTASPAAAHGSMTDPVSRVAACYAENPESPDSDACKAAVAASGTQAFYDWNEVNISNAAGNHQDLIPDGELCSAGRDKYKGLDLPRADWPASNIVSGSHTFRYKATAPHKGSFELYITKDSYDPTQPLKWSDLEEKPFAQATDPELVDGDYVIDGTVPAKSGRHLIYSIWQRSDSPEAFYTCSDVVFDEDDGSSEPTASEPTASEPTASEPTASAPTDEQIEAGRGRSTVDHGGHGGPTPDHRHHKRPSGTPTTAALKSGNSPDAMSAGESLAETGGSGSTTRYVVGGAALLALGAAVIFGTVRRRAGH
ncbi:lytic polysaccharide monooxygenase [Streptomyces sp. SCSIO 30461]|uniref:lytic polysaccharide monooxygenase auxiliary activity family 9 protein n=1 Tax=Streptomyces sp. SCSIO 30461 TaxID=3118085 RepID=UPI0030CEB423